MSSTKPIYTAAPPAPKWHCSFDVSVRRRDGRLTAFEPSAAGVPVSSDATFVASIGIRTLVIGAKIVQRRGGKLLLLSPQADVEQVLKTIGVTDLLPIMRDEAEAMAAIRS